MAVAASRSTMTTSSTRLWRRPEAGTRMGIRVLLRVFTGHRRQLRRTGNAFGSPAVEAARVDQLAAEIGLREPGGDRPHYAPSRLGRNHYASSTGRRSPEVRAGDDPAGSVEIQPRRATGPSACLVAGVRQLGDGLRSDVHRLFVSDDEHGRADSVLGSAGKTSRETTSPSSIGSATMQKPR